MTDIPVNVTAAVSPAPTPLNTCALRIRREYDVIEGVVCAICFLVGIIYCFCGCRRFKPIMFLSGLTFGSGLGYLLCLREQLADLPLEPTTRLGVALGVGALAGLVTALVRSVGLFLTGLQLGLLLSGTALLVAGQYLALAPPLWVPLGAALGVGLFCAVLALRWPRALTLAATATVGAAVVTACVDYCMETPPLPVWAYEGLQRNPRRPLCWYSWVVVGVWPALALLGALVQGSVTGRQHGHTELSGGAQQKQVCLMKIRQRESHRRGEGSYHRRAPPLRRYAGDVLAPSYLQSLRERQMSTGSSLSSLSTAHHTMIDFDFETGSMVPLTTSSSAILRV